MAEKPADASNLQSPDAFRLALVNQSGGAPAPKPNAQGRDLNIPPATIGANQSVGQWLRGFLPGFDAGTSDATKAAPQPEPGFWERIGASRPLTGSMPAGGRVDPTAPPTPVVQQFPQVQPAGPQLPPIEDFLTRAGLTGSLASYKAGQAQQPAAPAAPAPQPIAQTVADVTNGGAPLTGDARAAAQAKMAAAYAVAPNINPNAQPGPAHPLASWSPHHAGTISPKTHSLQDFVNATEGMSYRQMSHLLAWAPQNDMSNPASQAQAGMNDAAALISNSYEKLYQQAMANGGHVVVNGEKVSAPQIASWILDTRARAMPSINPINTAVAGNMRPGEMGAVK